MDGWRMMIGVWAILTWIATSSSVLAQDAHSQHGVHATGTVERVFHAKMSVPGEIRPGKSFAIDIQIQDDQGRKVADFDLFQEKLMHLILVSDDLAVFSHLHPVHKGSGHFQMTTVLPSAGGYTLFSDYKPAGDKEQVSVLKLRLKGTERPSGVQDAKIMERVVRDVRVRMSVSPKRVKTNEEVIITFDLKQMNGKPVVGLKPYLGEKGHLVVIRQAAPLTGRDYIHAHALKEGGASEIKFATRFPEEGLYKLWCQFNSRGRILTADFWINIER